MRKKKSTFESICETRKIVMPEHINPHGTLFGGTIMSWIDKTAYMCAQNYAECYSTVTANIDHIHFFRPAKIGDQVIIKSMVSYVGNTSMEIDVSLETENAITKEIVRIGDASLTFVAIDTNGKKKIVPELVLSTQEDYYRHKNAYSRILLREQMKRQLEENKIDLFLPPTKKQSRTFSFYAIFHSLLLKQARQIHKS
ncbi:MAG: acyl-CoA thioesterase [Bacteriovoracaceae bacterium]